MRMRIGMEEEWERNIGEGGWEGEEYWEGNRRGDDWEEEEEE